MFVDGDDEAVEARRQALVSIVTGWATKHDLWHDARFTTWLEYYDSEPEQGELANLAIMTFEGPLYGIFNLHYPGSGELLDEFNELVWSNGFHMEREDHTTASFYLFDDEDALKPLLEDRNAWLWTLRLMRQMSLTSMKRYTIHLRRLLNGLPKCIGDSSKSSSMAYSGIMDLAPS